MTSNEVVFLTVGLAVAAIGVAGPICGHLEYGWLTCLGVLIACGAGQEKTGDRKR